MITTQFACPLCGHGFDPAAHLACQTCPLHAGCRLVCCPACGHTTVDQAQSRLVRWVSALFERAPARQDAPATAALAAESDARQCSLDDIPLGRRARVVDVSALPTAQREQLHGYGLLPGRVLRIMQRAPLTVVQIEHIELAIELDVARAVRVAELAETRSFAG